MEERVNVEEAQPRIPLWRKALGRIVGLPNPKDADLPYVGRISADGYRRSAARPEVQALIASSRARLYERLEWDVDGRNHNT